MADLSQFSEATAAVQHSPHAVSAWEEAESLAADLDKPDDIVALYTETLAGALEPQVAEMIGERAGSFCDEWFGDDPKVLEKILSRVLQLAPSSDSALQRLSVIYTVAERWADVLALYDRATDNTKDRSRKVRLLREAAQLAKDVANQPEKAIHYYQALLPLVPDDVQIGQSLERLLERHERWAELISLWEGRLEGQSKKDRERSRARIAGVWLDNLEDPQNALVAVKPLLTEADDDRESCALLERIIEAPKATKGVRDAALDLLRSHFDATSRPREVIRVLEKIIHLEPAHSRDLREEAGTRLADLDDVPAAMEHYAALLAIAPESSVTEEKLRQLADRGGQHERYADAVATASRGAPKMEAAGLAPTAGIDPTRKVELLAEAARTRLDRLSDVEGAIKLLVEASAVSGAAEHEQLVVARRLAGLYAQMNRPKERLAVLERQAHLEANDAARAAILSEAAKLAESLGDTDRALSLWERRVDSDPSDLSALDARISILESQQRWDDLVTALESRASKVASPTQKRADLVRVALIHHQERSDAAAAISTWQRVVADNRDDEEGISALADLLAETARWREMADLLEGASGRATARTIGRLVRLGDALRQHLDEPTRALAAYRNAIAIDPSSAPAKAGLTGLLEIAATRSAAADALAQAMRTTGDVTGVLDLLPARLAEAHDDRTKLALLREAAQLRLENKHDAPGALADLARAFPLAPRDQLIENQLQSLAKATGDYTTLGIAYLEGIAALGGDAREAARLRMAYADLAADRLSDPQAAAGAYAQVAETEAGNRRAVAAFAALGTTLAQWDEVAAAIVRFAEVREAFDDELLGTLEIAAKRMSPGAGSESRPLHSGAWDQVAHALTIALEKYKLPSAVAALFHHRLAVLHRDHRADSASAINSLRRALELGGERQAWLSDLVAMERDQGTSPQLLEALRRLADADGRDLDALVGAADVASKLGEREQALQILSSVLGRATAAWRGTASIKSARSVDAVAKWAIDGLVDLYRTGGRARAAVDTLVEAARLPFDQQTRREMRLRAAQLATVELGDNAAAIDMYRSVLAATPNDLEVIDRLAHLLGVEDRVPELLTLRQIQLGLETDLDKKLDLRLELARLVGIVEERGGRLDALRANLEDRPGHEASIDAVAQLLAQKGAHRQLADLLESQAQRLEGNGETGRASKLWAKFAGVAERDTKEIERAIGGHRRVVALSPTSESLRALARLNLERGQSAQAVPWLESLLGTVPASERMLVVQQLAKAHLSANQSDRAIAAIEVNLDDRAPAIELRTLLADLYRKADLWEPLARHLTRSLPLVRSDEKLAREFAREAVQLYLTKLGSPAAAIPALETALALDPTDKELRTALAIGQRVAGKLVEARALLNELITDFGRRRSPERAALHVELARVAQAEGKLDEAMSEMESASKMDVSNASIQKELAEMARTAGQLDKAERTYRALLLVVRRTPPGDDEAAVGPSEVLFELHQLAATHGEADQAKELLESAMESAIQSDAEVRRLRRSLLAHGEGERLLEVLNKRLATNPEPASQARLLADMGDALDGLGRGGEALDAMVRAFSAMPSRVDLYEKARDIARRTNATKKYVEAVESVVDRLRRKDDPPLIANLLMKAGESLEQEGGDLKGAANLYRRVEILGERLAEAFYAQARVAAAIGDTAEQARTLDKMFELAGTDSEPTPQQVDALYRLAEIFIGSATRRKQGIELLERAFSAEPRWGQAGRLLKMAAGASPDDDKILGMYERVARNGGDQELLLDFLERRAALSTATPQQIHEAVDLAVELAHDDRAEALLVRAVSAARETADGLGSAPWAVLALAERRLAANDLAAARDLTYEVAPIAEAEAVDGLAMRIATRALAHRKIDLAGDVYEFLRERSPADRAVWQPLLTIYRELGDGDRLGSVVSSTLPNLVTAAERNALRMEHAKFLIENLKRHHDALDVLRDALRDDPDNLEAAEMYEKTLQELGDDEGIAEFLWSRFEDAQRRGHRDSTVDVATRLGDLLEKQGSPDAIRVYRSALVIAPDDREILRRVVDKLDTHENPREGALLMERLLAVETPERAPELAGKLATMWEAAGDFKGVQRTLELAHKSAPDDGGIHDRLEQWYRDRELWAELADLMTRDAERMDDATAVTRLREAAAVYSGQLGQPLKAADVLRKARQRAPHLPELVTDQAAALAAAGELDAAQRAVGEALATVQGSGRTSLLLLRASFRQQLGDDASAVQDLTEAYELDKDSVAEGLVNGLERLRSRAERDSDLPTERMATLKLAQLLIAHGDLERGRGFLVAWIERDPRDAEPLHQLCDLDESIEHWDGVSAAATRLAYVTEGEAQVNAALRAADASTKAGRPADAVPVLELVHQQQPAVEVIRAKLREMYEAAGEFRLLAGILTADADHGSDPTARYANYKRAAELLLYDLQDAVAAQLPAQKALELQPDDHAALMLNVDVLITSGQLEDAGRTLEAAIAAQKKRTPELAVLQQRMARVCAMLNDKDGQLNWLKKAFDVDRKNAEVAAELAQLATEMGDYELALKPLRAITLMDNPAPVTRPMALLWEAKIEHARGNRAKAELWAKKALREDPQFADAQQFLDELGGA